MSSPPITIPGADKLRIVYLTDDMLSDDEYSTADEDEDSDDDPISFSSIRASPRIELPKLIVYILDEPFDMPDGHQLFFQRLRQCTMKIASMLVLPSSAPTSVRPRYPYFSDYCYATDPEMHVRYAIMRHGGPLVVIGPFDIYRLFTLRGSTNSPRCTNITVSKFDFVLRDVDVRMSDLSLVDKYDPFMSDAEFEVLHSNEEDKPIKLFFDSLYNQRPNKPSF